MRLLAYPTTPREMQKRAKVEGSGTAAGWEPMFMVRKSAFAPEPHVQVYEPGKGLAVPRGAA